MPASKAALDSATGPFVGKDDLNILHAIIDYAGDPTAAVTPDHIGQFCHDTTNDDLYWAHGTAAANWKIMAT